MSIKITPDHLSRAAVVYVRQSTMSQVMENLESQRRQYDLAQAAETAGFRSVAVIDDDLGRSGSGSTQRPGFERLVAMVCSGDVGAVYCIEASRLARNGRDWHHLIDLCALAGALVIDPDGAYDPRLVNDRLLLGLKGTMSEYELSLLRQRGIAARDSKVQRGEYRFMLPPGFCWNELGKIEIDPDEHVAGVVRLVFTKFRELGSARQVFLWLRAADIKMPVVLRNVQIYKLSWKASAYHTVMQILHNPLYAGAYAFGRIAQKTRIVDGRARKVSGFKKPREEWNVLLRDNHPGYISWQEYEDNQTLLLENALMAFMVALCEHLPSKVSLDCILRILFERSGARMETVSQVVYWVNTAGVSLPYRRLLAEVVEGLCAMELRDQGKPIRVYLKDMPP